MKKVLYFLFILIMCGCSSDGEPKYRIGVSQCSDDDWRDKLNDEIRREMLFYEDAQVDIRTANDDNEKQIADIQYFIDNDYDIIVAAPNQAQALTPVLSKAYRQGIPVVIFDRGVDSDDYTAFIEFDNYGIGASAGEYAASSLPGRGQVIEITGLEGSTPALERHNGFVSALNQHPQIELLTSVSGAWKEDIAARVIDSLLALYPNVDLIYAQNDLMAKGVSNVLTRRGKRDKVTILGTDAAPNVGIRAVADSVIDATFIYPTDGYRLMKTAMQILRGEPYQRTIISPALPPVDRHNAKILLRQDEMLKDETSKILALKAKNDIITDRHKAQTSMLYMAIAGGLLLILLIAGLLVIFWQKVKYQRILSQSNHDLQQERNKQQELYQKLDEATASKLMFFTNVSHDFRTPLALIAAPVEQVAAEEYLTPNDRSLMQIAVKNIRILRRLIDQILDFRTFENGHSQLLLSEVRIEEAITDWFDSFKSIAAKRHIKLTLNKQCDSTETIAVDIEKLERVFFNLVSNAFKYSPDNGHITVDCQLTASRLIVKVTDTGYGIKAEDRDKIFDRFYQVDQVKPKGSGIGLSLAKAFVELHNGSLTVESEYGKGSTFIMEIPVKHVNQDPTTAIPLITETDIATELSPLSVDEKALDDTKPLVLLVDDNSDLRHLVSKLLSDDYNVIQAVDGRQGLKLATKYVPDLIITDIMMPVMDGLEFCRQLKSELATSHIPVLVLTACRLDQQRLESYDSGADGYLSKPFTTALLLSRCRNLLENRRRIKDIYSTPHQEKKSEKAPLPTDINDTRSAESEFYNSFITILKELYTDSSLTTDQLAARIGLGAAQLTRKIRALTNFTPAEILRNYRLEKARALVLSSEKTLSEIAYQVGFSSPAYFSKCFKEAYGETPSELRSK